jgi:hypothetical protein
MADPSGKTNRKVNFLDLNRKNSSFKSSTINMQLLDKILINLSVRFCSYKSKSVIVALLQFR